MKKLLTLAICAFLFGNAQAQKWDWAKTGGGKMDDAGHAIAVDAAGAAYVTGFFTGEMTLGDKKLVSEGLEDAFIAKYKPTGEVEWLVKAGGPEKDMGNSIAVDHDGSVLVAGIFSKTAKFDLKTAKAVGQEDVFVAKYGKDGKNIWVKHGGGTGSDFAAGVDVDQQGNVFIAGYIDEMAAFDKVELKGDSREIVVAKFAKTGEVVWAKMAGGEDACEALSVNLDGDGNVYIGGIYNGEAHFDSQKIESQGFEDIFVAKYANDGALQWVRSAGGKQSEGISSMATDKQGDVYITGYYRDICQFGGTALACLGEDDMFVVKYSALGDVVWARSAGGQGLSNGNGLTTDASGACYITGYFQKSVKFGDFGKECAGQSDVFVVKYQPNGEAAWVATAGDISGEVGNGIAIDANGQLYITGYFTDKTRFADQPSAALGGNDVFVAKVKVN